MTTILSSTGDKLVSFFRMTKYKINESFSVALKEMHSIHEQYVFGQSRIWTGFYWLNAFGPNAFISPGTLKMKAVHISSFPI